MLHSRIAPTEVLHVSVVVWDLHDSYVYIAAAHWATQIITVADPAEAPEHKEKK